MANSGIPEMYDVTAKGKNKQITVVAARWNAEAMDGLIAGAKRCLAAAQANYRIVRVPGTFELSLGAKLAATQGADGVVALGVVIRGGTPHFDYVCQAATYGLTKVSVENQIPIGFGILTCDNDEQARDRAGLEGSSEDKGYEAAAAVVEMLGQSSQSRSVGSR